jgi:signal transduction histidine kinase
VVKLNSVIDDALKIFSCNPYHENITIIKDLQGTIMTEVDPQQIKQVLWNLFINAAQAMDLKGKLKVSTKIMQSESIDAKISLRLESIASELWSQIIVTDTGCGISEKYLDKIFDPFFTTREKGIGLGLAIVYSIIESYRGTILVESESGKGSHFTIYLPAITNH